MLHEAKRRPQGWKQPGLVHGGGGPGEKPRLVIHRVRRDGEGWGKQQQQQQRSGAAAKGMLNIDRGGVEGGKSRADAQREREAWERFDQQVGIKPSPL